MTSKGRQILSWCLFDFANSSFTTVIVTGVFSIWFTKTICSDPDQGNFLWSVALFISNFLIILTAPVVGAIADHGGGKKPLLFLSYLACVIGTGLLFFADHGDVVYAMVIFVIANFAFASGENLVAGFLPELAEPDEIAKVSSWGWGIGYIGGLLALFLSILCIKSFDDNLGPRLTNVVVALFFLLGGLPTFLFVKERAKDRLSFRAAAQVGMAESRQTLVNRRGLRDLFAFFLASLVLQIGIYGVIQFAGIYGSRLAGLDTDKIMLILMISQVSAFIGALSAGVLARRWGALRMVSITAVLWTIAGLTLCLAPNELGFIVAAQIAGFAMGSSLSSIRAVVGRLAPKNRVGEIFGFWGFFARIAAVIAPLGNTVALALSGGDPRAGILFFVACFIASLFFLARVDEARGLEVAQRA